MGRGAGLGERACADRVARERRGEGAEGSLPVTSFGMVLVSDWEAVPEGAANTHSWFGPNDAGEEDFDAFWGSWPVVTITPDVPLHTMQAHVSALALDEEADDDDLPLLVLADGQTWIIDGHHRLVRARREGRPQEARLADYAEAVAGGWFEALLGED
jgi:hypothetical protein